MTSPAEVRQAAIDVAQAAEADLRAVWASVSTLDAPRARDALLSVLPSLVDEHGVVAAAVAADYYDEARDEAGVPGSFRAVPADPAPIARLEALVRWGVDPLFAAEPDGAAALERLTSGTRRVVIDFQRETIVESVERDPKATGWRRVGRGGSCPFCSMLISRGGQYRSGSSASFRSHNHCKCVAVPSWDPNAAPVSSIAYVASKRERTDAERAAVRSYLRANYPA